MKRRVLIALVLCSVIGVCPQAFAARKKLTGKWRVKTTLVAAQDAVNPDYQVGMNRVERWYVTGSKNAPVLRSDTGGATTITGHKEGQAWVFEDWFDTGYGIAIHMYIVVRQTNARKMKGTIEARYYETTFGQIMGIDAWSLKASK